jgi:hypothetical protein
MGDRGNVVLTYEQGGKIYFYTHWQGSNLREIVRQALIRGKSRWDDEPYLSRIILSEMVKDNVLEETGYGIAPYEMDSGALVKINLKERSVDGIKFADYILSERTEGGLNG